MELAFAWWVPHTLKKCNRIISKVRLHKFRIRIPKSVEEAKQLDQENGDTQWRDAICKEMQNVMLKPKLDKDRQTDCRTEI